MNKYLLLSLYVFFFISPIVLVNNQEKIPIELIHGECQMDFWEKNKFYEYYLDISEYILNEENIIEIYGREANIDIYDFEIYLLLTNISNAEFIKNGTIKPNIIDSKDKYQVNGENIKLDSLNKKYYFFLPIKKISPSQKYLIILIKHLYSPYYIFLYVSKRIPLIEIEQIDPNNIEVSSKEIEMRDDIRLYYKIDISRINKIKNNIYFYIEDMIREYDEKEKEVNFYMNLSSLHLYNYNLLIIEKNTTNLSYFFLGIKSINNIYEIGTKISIRIDDNEFIHINTEERNNKQIYIEQLNCDKNLFVIENYNYIDTQKQKYLILDSLYGNYSFKQYDHLNDFYFEYYDECDGNEIKGYITPLNEFINIYILKCFTPTAFHFEIFTEEDTPENMLLGRSIKTYFPDNYSNNDNRIILNGMNEYEKYKLNFRVLDKDPGLNRTITCYFLSQGQDYYVEIPEPYDNYTELFYAYYTKQDFGFSTNYNILIEYYYTSNNLYTNIVEGRTVLERNNLFFYTAAALKIRKDISFDYISFEAICEEEIDGLYEIKLVNENDIEEESNILLIGLPKNLFPYSFSINLKISNPYDKYDQLDDIDNDDNNYYLLLQFNIFKKPVYINIEYVKNEQIINLPISKSKNIVPQTEYEINLDKNDYRIKDKLIFNINKCNNLANYTLFNYHENKNNIIKETKIENPHQTVILDNRYKKTKIMLHKESEEEEIKNDSIIYPAAYYNKGDILLNYFLIESPNYKELKFTSDFNINYEEETRSNLILSWKEYVYRESNNEKINMAINYSIYILPKNSVANTICQLFLIPVNKTIINSTKIKIELNEGEYKIFIIASVIEENMPFEIMYNVRELNIIKKSNTILIVLLSLSGIIVIILVILLFIFRKKITALCKGKKLLDNISDFDINSSITDINGTGEGDIKENKKHKLSEELIKMMNKK